MAWSPIFKWPGDAHLPGQCHVIPDLGAAGNADLRDDQAILPNGHVVRDLHEVVDFGAFADDRRPQRAAVNGDVGADFHVVVNDDVADLRHFAMDAGVENIAKTVGPDHRAGMDPHALADLCLIIQDDVREKAGSRPQWRSRRRDGCRRARPTRGADFDFLANDAIRPDMGAGIDLRRGRHDRRGMDARRQKSAPGKNIGNTRAKAMRALATRMMTFCSDLNGPSIRMAEAALCSALPKNVSFSAKVRSPALAAVAGAKPVS